MKSNLSICWIIPQYTQLRLVPDVDSPLYGLVAEEGETLSYDGQSNYPHSTGIISVARQLQSSMGNVKVGASVLNLAAVPREQFIDGSWEENYLGEKFDEVPYGKSKLEFRRIGLDIDQVKELDRLAADNDFFVIPSSFETHVPELRRLAHYLKNRFGRKIKLLASGTGVEGHEKELLSSGFDLVFTGSVTDRGDKVAGALIGDYQDLAAIPGVYTDLTGEKTRNVGARSFRQEPKKRREEISQWKNRLESYLQFVDVDIQMVGRPDLTTQIQADPLVDYCCSMQDLPFHTVSDLVSSGREVVFAADELFPMVGCPRECDFCHASGRGSSSRDVDYSLKLLRYYKSLGVTDLIPTDDQVLLGASSSVKAAEELIEIFSAAREMGFSFFYGNGVETYALAQIIEKSLKKGDAQKIYSELINQIFATTSYIYLPYEDISGLLSGGKTDLRKLSMGKSGLMMTFRYLNDHSEKRGLEVGSNIIFSENPAKEEIQKYYQIMDGLAAELPNLNIRYNGFFMIPSSCAPHILNYRSKYDLELSDRHPELKIVSIPNIKIPGETNEQLEQKLAWHIQARDNSKSRRRLHGGTYDNA